MRRTDAAVLATGVPVGRPLGPAQTHPHPRRGPGGVPGRTGPPGPAVLPLQPPGDLAGVRAGGAGRTALLLPRLALRRGGAHPRHAAGTPREHREGPSLAPRLSGAGVRRPAIRLHGSAGQDAAAAPLRRVGGGRRHAETALRPARGRRPGLQLAPERGKPHGRPPRGVAAHGAQRRPVPHPGPFDAAGTAGLRGDRHRHALHHDPRARRRALGRRHLGEHHAAQRAPDLHGRARDREGEPGVFLRARGRYPPVGRQHPLDTGRRRPLGVVRPGEARAGGPGTAGLRVQPALSRRQGGPGGSGRDRDPRHGAPRELGRGRAAVPQDPQDRHRRRQGRQGSQGHRPGSGKGRVRGHHRRRGDTRGGGPPRSPKGSRPLARKAAASLGRYPALAYALPGAVFPVSGSSP